MEFTARFNNIEVDSRGEVILSLVANERQYVAEHIEELKQQKTLTVNIDKYKEKRSLNANAYAWVLMQEIAKYEHTDKWSVYLIMLQRYSDKFTHIIVPEEALELAKEQWRTTVELGKIRVNGRIGIQLQCYYGSHHFNKEEMGIFIDGLIMECEEKNIAVLPPERIKKMKEEWNPE